ncbi:MAG: PIN domain-containing protein [Deltaproteobacteria bacterium]|nr:PIN domain-containing protein [Deltaproteobacteria bacterium]
MTAPPDLLLLDTSIVLHLVRGNDLAARIDKAYDLRGRAERPLISVVTVGEAHSFATRLGWGIPKRGVLDELLRELVVVDIQHGAVLRKYAEIDVFLKKHGRTVGDNDTWIAATAAAFGALLLTADKDFDPLDPLFIRRVCFDPHAQPDPIE